MIIDGAFSFSFPFLGLSWERGGGCIFVSLFVGALSDTKIVVMFFLSKRNVVYCIVYLLYIAYMTKK